jgi:hypothetical protein
MIYSNEKPPVYDRCVERFGVDWNNNVAFTYGKVLHCKEYPTPDLIVHEEVHTIQQTKIGIEEWWNKYLADNEFRLSQELEAYRKQYQFLKRVILDRNKLNKYNVWIAKTLSGSMYGNIITYSEAFKLIRNEE